jgi:class 3 adenylate cyclase/tetratricopeptide (TPR) repeat protein
VTDSPSAESRLSRLLDRLLTAAEASLVAGDLESARATADEVRAVDPDNARAALLLQQVAARQHDGASGERALMTLLFADIVSSTRLSERLEPEQLRDLFSFYRAAAREAVERYGGYVMKYMGDGILAGFGYPEPHEDDGRRAVLAALDLVTAVRDARGDLERRLGEAPQVRIGIHTGQVVVADLSDKRSSDEKDSIVGVAPNLAARIQQAAEPDMVVISDVTEHLVDTDFYMQSLGERDLKGISRPVEVFAVDRVRHAGARFYAERYRQGELVGRDEPHARLVAAWEATRAVSHSTPAAFVVSGEAGIGKTRLVAEIVETVETTGGRVLGAGCLPYYSNVSLWPIARLIERSLGVVAEDADRLGALVASLESLGLDPATSVPVLGALIGATDPQTYPPPELDPAALLDETLRQLVDWLTALAESTPRMIVVEDLHWADPSTVALVGRLVERRPPRVLTVASTRHPADVPWLDAAEHIELRRLDESAADGLVHSLLADLQAEEHLTDEQRSTIVTQAQGIPLFVEELTRSYLSESRTDRIPLRLQELLAWRLKAPGVDQRVAQVAATVGPVFDAATVAAVVGDRASVAGQLEVLLDAGIIERDDPELDTYHFRHALMRDAAYETQVIDVRQRTHAAVADTIADRGGEPALVAEHLDLAGEPGRAAGQYVVAAQAEQARGAHSEAAKLLTRAVDLLDQLEESDDRDLGELTARMLRAFSVSSVQGYAAPEVQADHRRLDVLTRRLGTRPEVLPSLIAIWAYWLTSGELGTGRGLIDRLDDLVSQDAYAWFEPEVESCAGYQSMYEGHLDVALDHLERAMAGFGARPADQIVSPFWPLPNDPVAVSAVALACVHALRGELDQVDRWIEQAEHRAEEIGFPRGPFSLAFVKTYEAWVRRFLADDEASVQLGSEVVGIGMEYGYTYWMLLGSTYVGSVTPGSGPDLEFLEQNLATLRAIGHIAFSASSLARLAELVARAGDVDRAAELVAEGIEVVHKTGEHLHLPELLRLRGEYALARWGDAEEAAADLREAVQVADQQGAGVSRLRAALALARLPEASRPADWRAVLEAARAALPTSGAKLPEATAADELLAGT